MARPFRGQMRHDATQIPRLPAPVRRRKYLLWSSQLLLIWQVLGPQGTEARAESSSPDRIRFSLPGRRAFSTDDEELYATPRSESLFGAGREFNLFETPGLRGGNAPYHDHHDSHDSSRDDPFRASDPSLRESIPVNNDAGRRMRPETSYTFPQASSRRSSAAVGSARYGSTGGRRPYPRRRPGSQPATLLQPLHDWWEQHVTPNVKAWPRLQCRVEPTTTLKIRKTFRPLKTIVRLGADFNTQLGVWKFQSSWEEPLIGGKLTLIAGRELQLTKSWALSVGGVDDLVTRLRFRAAVDLQTWKAYARVGFRTERLSPINVMEGFTLLKRLPLDGNKGHIKLEVKANLALPEPEIEYSTETQRSLIGMGDIQMNIEELNLVLDY